MVPVILKCEQNEVNLPFFGVVLAKSGDPYAVSSMVREASVAFAEAEGMDPRFP
jgi:extradiol dioxygenase family protein